MRPVTRGDAPPAAKTCDEMRPTLLGRLGCYCSYCEYPVSHVPHIEHIVPKERFKDWRHRWDNLIVSCTWCNSHKGSKLPVPGKLDDYLWPTRDNTARAFTYVNVIPEVANGLADELRHKAAHLRGLVQLGLPDDDRAKARAETFILAQKYFSQMSSAPDPALVREAIVELALAKGFFSVWMDVFATDPGMRRSLINSFKGPRRTASIRRRHNRSGARVAGSDAWIHWKHNDLTPATGADELVQTSDQKLTR
jgi:uncharacterized protein (TIGR02646 family)